VSPLGRVAARIAVFNVAVIAAILVLAGGAVYLVARSSLASAQDTALEQSAASLLANPAIAAVYRQGTFTGHEDDDDDRASVVATEALLLDTRGAPLPGQGTSLTLVDPAARASALVGEAAFGWVDTGAGRYRVLTVPVRLHGALVGAAQVALSDEGRHDALETVGRSLALVGLGALAAALAAAALVTARGMRPVREAFARQRAFIAEASHQLKTPVAVVRADAEALARTREHLDPEDAQLLDDLLAESVFLSGLVAGLLAVARLEEPPQVRVREPVDLAALAREVAHAAERLAAAAQVSVDVEAPGAPVRVLGDPVALRLALLALADNAIKYNRPGGWVRLSVAQRDGWAELTVADNGQGIAPADQERVWERFYRAPGAQASGIEGAGLGMAIIRQVAERHGGAATLQSGPGQGTTVTLRLRVAAP
jgi:signal transduction histidine kinase